jgi:hypothetical protein
MVLNKRVYFEFIMEAAPIEKNEKKPTISQAAIREPHRNHWNGKHPWSSRGRQMHDMAEAQRNDADAGLVIHRKDFSYTGR